MKIKFCGAAREVTGSAHLVTLNSGYQILLDCGLYQGTEDALESFNTSWYFDPAKIDCVVLSHAHIDHSGRLPKLVKDGFNGHIHCTHATRSLCGIMLLDSAHIQERDAEYYNRKQLDRKEKDIALREPLYTRKNVKETMNLFSGHAYNRWYRIADQVEVMFRDAGHILGSASVTLRIYDNDRTIHLGFSGDIGRPLRPILRDPQPMPEVDYLICESTYGDKKHESAPEEYDRLLRIIKETCVEKKGKLIIPAFSVGRTQEIVYMLDRMETEGLLPRIPVYVDSPLAVNATTIYGAHPECYDDDLTEYLFIDENPFGFNRLTYIHDVEGSKALNTDEEPSIIISASGMITAGRIKHHVFNNIDQKNNTILIVGYCTPHSPCGLLRNGAKEIRLFGQEKIVHAKIEVMDSFSAHADQLEILEFVRNQRGRVKTIFLVHGEIDRQEQLQKVMNTYGFDQVQIPKLEEEVIL